MNLRALALLLSCGLTVASAAEDLIEFIENSAATGPSRTLEFRFTEEMVAPENVQKGDVAAPIEITPAAKGKWTWQSTRSGVFSPAQPWPLSTTIQIKPREGATTLAGKPLPRDWHRTLEMPPFTVVAWSSLSYQTQENQSAEPRYMLLFNEEVSPDGAPQNFVFTRAGGENIPANVTSPDSKNPGLSYFQKWIGNDRSLLTWKERFNGQPMAQNAPRKNQLFITPTKPLKPGENWRLIVAAGVPSMDPALRTLSTVEVPVGMVRPFEVKGIEATNYLNQGRQLRITFNKGVNRDLKTEDLAKWITVSPAPEELKVTVEGAVVAYTGKFALEQEYRVAVEPGLSSDGPLKLESGKIEMVSFEPVPPRLYFEAFGTHQLSSGLRKFHLLAVNVPKLRVTAKLFTGTGIPAALRGYEGYFNAPKDSEDESYSKVDVDKLPGQLIWREEVAGSTALDEQQEIEIDWSRMLGPERRGIVLLTAEAVKQAGSDDPRPGAQAIVQLTDLGAVWKRSPGETFVQVFSMKSGKAVPGAVVRLLNEKDQPIGKAKSDENGIARLPAGKTAKWLAIESGADSHFIEFRYGRSYIDLARVDVSFDEEEDTAPDTIRAFLFTERGVYRPGETVHLKGILRDYRAGHKPLAPGTKAQLTVEDARERQFYTKEVTLSAMGSFSEDIALPQGSLGVYTASFSLLGDDAPDHPISQHEFQVEEFKPNAFEVLISEAPKTPGPLQLALPTTAKYYMGKPLSKAQLSWSISAHDETFEPEGFDDFDFAYAVRDYRLEEHLERRSGFDQQGKSSLDAEGKTTIEASVPINTKAPQPREVRVLCEVTDVNQQTVSSATTFTQHSSDFYLGFRQFRSLLHEGEPVPLEVVAVRTDETPTPEPVTVEAQLILIAWQTNRVEGQDETVDYENAPNYVPIAKRTFKTAAVSKTGDRWQVGKTEVGEPLIPEKPGHYLLELTAKDAAGRAVVTTTSFQVYGTGATAWDYRNPFQVELVSEKDDYTAGETAKVLVKTPISGEALVTIERERVLRSFVTHLEGNAPVIEIPVEPGDAPNIFVSVMLLRGAADSPRKIKAPEYRVGYCELKVVNPAAKLTVYVKPEQKAYRPGDKVTVSAEVLDASGRPLRDAEVTLYAVDEGILSLTGYEVPDPLTFFNEPRSLSVSTALTLPELLSEDPEERDFSNKGYLVGGGGDDANNLRKNFLPCAFWNSTLRSDAAGKVLASFTAPDSLTRYRVMAVVQTAKDQFGNAESAFEVNKPVMLEPALPRFANVGDKLSIRAVVHNTTDLAGEVEVRAQFDSSVKAGERTRTVPLAAKESIALDFPVEFIGTGTAVWKWSAQFHSGETVYSDAVQTKLKVGYPAPLLKHVKTTRIEGDVANLLAGVDPQIMEGRGTVRVSFTNSRGIELQEAIEQLLHYPYGCVEQTTSSTLPWLTLRKMRDQLPALQRSDDEISRAIRRGVDRLFTMQTDSGGLAYWPGESQPMLWGSAYGSLALTMAKQQGYAVPADDFDRILKWMSEQLRGTAEVKAARDLSPRVLTVYALALAGRAEPAYHEVLFQRRNELSTEDRALLALAVIESKGQAQMVDELLKPSPTKDDEDWFWCDSRSTSLQLLCWTRHQAKSTRADTLADDLFNQRRGGHWWTTQGNAWAVIALSDYLARTETNNRNATGRLAWGGETAGFSLGTKAETKTQAFPVSPETANLPLRLEGLKAGRLYTEVRVEAYPPLREQPAQDRGYLLKRRYARIEDDGTLTDAKDLRVGDRVLITLDLEVRQRASYLAIEDPLPAVFEAVNPTFKTQQTRAGEQVGVDWLSDFHELREDRALFFANHIAPGHYTIRYLARVAAAGEATAPSAKVEEMYRPERCGLTDSFKLTTAALK